MTEKAEKLLRLALDSGAMEGEMGGVEGWSESIQGGSTNW
jgi:hypothetical protein